MKRSFALQGLIKHSRESWRTLQEDMEIRQARRCGFSHSTHPARLFSVITSKRWQLTEHLQHPGPSIIHGLARSSDRDVKRVHDDVTAMMDWGLVERNDDGMVHVPYIVIHAAFDLKAVA